jgi:hypothetical protein
MPSSGGGGGGGGDSGRGVGVGGPGSGGAWGGDNGAAAQGARNDVANQAGADLNGGDNNGPRRSGDEGQQQGANYNQIQNQIQSLSQSDAQDSAAANPGDASQAQGGGSQDPLAPTKKPCDALQLEVNAAQYELDTFDWQQSQLRDELGVKQGQLQNLPDAMKKVASDPAAVDKAIAAWSPHLSDDAKSDTAKNADAIVKYMVELRETGSSNPLILLNYYKKAIDQLTAQLAAGAVQRVPLADKLQSVQAQLKACQSQ